MALDILGQGSGLSEQIDGFQERPQQQEMAAAIQAFLESEGVLVVEAGTGVGKTFAYLVPALLSGERVVVSTGSKALQDQLYFKDLPVVCQSLKSTAKHALLKGRANYLCLHRLRLTELEGRLPDRRHVSWLRRIGEWSALTKTGDIAEMTAVPRETDLWGRVTSTVDNCLGADCGDYQDCFVVKARRKALEADVVVVNHHLFFADMVLKDDGFGELLPSTQLVILDEAHQLPEIASAFFSQVLSSRQLQEWSRDTRAESLDNAADMPQIREQLQRLDKTVMDLRLLMDAPGQRAPWAGLRDQPAAHEQVENLAAVMEILQEMLGQAAERSKGLAACAERLNGFYAQLLSFQKQQSDVVQWYETFTRGFALTATPLDIKSPLQRCMNALPCRWVMTSATLSVADSFAHFNQRLGLDEVQTLQLNSPFDYWNNALLYMPQGLPEPREATFVESVVDAAIPVINACRGRTFMLFTSYRALREAAERLDGVLDYPLLVQGESPPRDMIARFRELGNAVLLGTTSFWEGVDVRGEALSCVIIDKLPFAALGDPVLEARLDYFRQQGRNPFMEYQLPQAVIMLKQGIGRLIRDQQDRGVLMLCDTRLLTKPYGQMFLQSLPRMPRTRKLTVVERFFSQDSDKPFPLPEAPV